METKIKGDKIKESSIPLSALEEMPYAYPVETYDGKENKVIGLGGDCQYVYVGELVASEFGTPTEEKVIGDVMHTSYIYQPIYDGKYIDSFEEIMTEKYITLYIGNDVDGYTSNKVYISEDANNLTYYVFNFVGGFGPRSLEVAISPDYVLHCRNYLHYANKNSKIFFALYKQQLDVNLIPQEIARKEDVATESIKTLKDYNNSDCSADFTNYVAENGNITFGLYIMRGELGAKLLHIYNYIEGIGISFQYKEEDQDYFYYSSDVADIRIDKTPNLLVHGQSAHRYMLYPHKHVFCIDYDTDNDTVNFSRIQSTFADNVFETFNTHKMYGFKIYLNYYDTMCIIDSPYFQDGSNNKPDVYAVCLKNKYIEFKKHFSVETVENMHYEKISLEVTKEIDLNSIESRLAALEAKVGTL